METRLHRPVQQNTLVGAGTRELGPLPSPSLLHCCPHLSTCHGGVEQVASRARTSKQNKNKQQQQLLHGRALPSAPAIANPYLYSQTHGEEPPAPTLISDARSRAQLRACSHGQDGMDAPVRASIAAGTPSASPHRGAQGESHCSVCPGASTRGSAGLTPPPLAPPLHQQRFPRDFLLSWHPRGSSGAVEPSGVPPSLQHCPALPHLPWSPARASCHRGTRGRAAPEAAPGSPSPTPGCDSADTPRLMSPPSGRG